MKKIKKLYYRIKQSLIKRFNAFIEFHYWRLKRKHEFLLTYKEIRVKKGKIKYTLLIFDCPNGKLRFNLGRHFRGRNFSDQLNLQWI